MRFDRAAGRMFVDRTGAGRSGFSEEFAAEVHQAPLVFDDEVLSVRAFLDATSLELFVDDGALAFTTIFFPTAPYDALRPLGAEGPRALAEVRAYALGSIW